ncbi:MAG: ATP synthase F1 subunit gamma [Myxococcota bacterium]|nr:ATP synthase F1 subunit gamma [Myxococcota bacterium]
MATLRDLRKRLKAVKSTEKITKAMKMVAASKLKRAQDSIIAARPYAIRMADVMQHIVSRSDLEGHPLLTARVPKRIEVLMITSDRGLCGSFNSNIIRTAERYLRDNKETYEEIKLSTIGKKGYDHFNRKGESIHARYQEVFADLRFERASDIAADLSERFRSGEVDVVYVLYNEFKSAISQDVVLKQILPVLPLEDWEKDPTIRIGELAAISGDTSAVAGSGANLDEAVDTEWTPSEKLEHQVEGFEHEYEPSREAVLDTLLPQNIGIQVYRALLESIAAEHGARMSAMDAASRNAKDMIGKLVLQINRARQAAITTELSEIVSGAESLKG